MLSTEQAVREHIHALAAMDVTAIVNGYADDAVILSVSSPPLVGIKAIREVFSNLPAQIPPGFEFDFSLCHGPYIAVTYRTAAMDGCDTFVVRDGKILMQSIHIVALSPT